MMFVNWYPDPRFTNPKIGQPSTVTIQRWRDGVGVSCHSNKETYFQFRDIPVPSGEKLNIVCSITGDGEPNLQWQTIGRVYDTATGSGTHLCLFGKSYGEHIHESFVAPESGKIGIQFTIPNDGREMIVSELAIVSDAGLAWMRENDQWWIHHALMPLPR